MSSGISFSIMEYLPKDFLNKTVNEPFIQKAMSIALQNSNWRQGNPDIFEPDYFCGETPFEFTLASNSKKKNNFIQQFKNGKYNSEDIENDVLSYIEERIADKATRNYSVTNVHLCVLCVIELSDWVSDEYGSLTHDLFDWRRETFFSSIKAKYIETNIFSNIFLIFPDYYATWWVWDVLNDIKCSIQLSENDISSGKYPYLLIKNDELEDDKT